MAARRGWLGGEFDEPVRRREHGADVGRPGHRRCGADEVSETRELSYALVTLDGEWIQRDRFGPFVSPQPDEVAATPYARQATAYLENLDGDSRQEGAEPA